MTETSARVPLALIAPNARPAWIDLLDALHGVTPPCADAPEDWFGFESKVIDAAIAQCETCPAIGLPRLRHRGQGALRRMGRREPPPGGNHTGEPFCGVWRARIRRHAVSQVCRDHPGERVSFKGTGCATCAREQAQKAKRPAPDDDLTRRINRDRSAQ